MDGKIHNSIKRRCRCRYIDIDIDAYKIQIRGSNKSIQHPIINLHLEEKSKFKEQLNLNQFTRNKVINILEVVNKKDVDKISILHGQFLEILYGKNCGYGIIDIHLNRKDLMHQIKTNCNKV